VFELVSRPGGDILAELGAGLCVVSAAVSMCLVALAAFGHIPCRALSVLTLDAEVHPTPPGPALRPGTHTAFTAVHLAPHRPPTPPTHLTHSPRQNGGHAPNPPSTPHKAQRACLATCIPPVWVSESFGGLPVSSVHRLPLNLLLRVKPRRTRRATAGPWLMLCDG
jgi:hypothetical protein